MHSQIKLPCGVMVAQQILVLFVWVRVLAGQHNAVGRQRFSYFMKECDFEDENSKEFHTFAELFISIYQEI